MALKAVARCSAISYKCELPRGLAQRFSKKTDCRLDFGEEHNLLFERLAEGNESIAYACLPAGRELAARQAR